MERSSVSKSRIKNGASSKEMKQASKSIEQTSSGSAMTTSPVVHMLTSQAGETIIQPTRDKATTTKRQAPRKRAGSTISANESIEANLAHSQGVIEEPTAQGNNINVEEHTMEKDHSNMTVANSTNIQTIQTAPPEMDYIDSIANEVWPILGEIEHTRFALKNQAMPTIEKTLREVHRDMAQDDGDALRDSQDDESRVQSFLAQAKFSEPLNQVSPVLSVQPQLLEQPPTILPLVNEPDNLQDNDDYDDANTAAPGNEFCRNPGEELSQEEKVAREIMTMPSQHGDKKSTMIKFIALGLADIYMSKTASLLSPLKFFIEHKAKLVTAIIQFMVPLLMTWWLITHVPTIGHQLSNFNVIVRTVFHVVFYFASMFMWISGQVVFSGIFNILKKSLTDVAKAGQNRS